MDIQDDGHIGGRSGLAIALMVFCVFAVSVVTVMIMGVNTYNNIIEYARESNNDTAVPAYVWTKIKNGDEENKVYAGLFHGISALFVEEEIRGITYYTAIYQHDGFLREMFYEQGFQSAPGQGVPITPSPPLIFENDPNGMIKVTIDSQEYFISTLGFTT